MNEKTPRIVRGKPGSPTEGRSFIATFEGQNAARDILVAAGSTALGQKGDLTLWGMAAGMNDMSIEALCEAAIAAEAGTGPVPAPEAEAQPAAVEPEAAVIAPVKETAATVPDETIAKSKTDAVEAKADPVKVETPAEPAPAASKAPAPEPAAPAATRARGDGDPLSFGWRTGMSVAEWDKLRVPVPVGSVKVGDIIDVGGVQREIVLLGGMVNPVASAFDALKARFPDVELVPDTPLQMMMWAAEPEPETDSRLAEPG